MKRIKRVWKIVMAFFAVAMIPLVMTACAKRSEQTSTETPAKAGTPAKTEKPSGEHPEHPK